MEKEVNLEEILSVIFKPDSRDCTTIAQDLQLAITLNPDLNRIKWAMREACRQVLELASENATAKQDKIRTYPYKDYPGMYHDEKVIIVDKQSITNTINQVK